MSPALRSPAGTAMRASAHVLPSQCQARMPLPTAMQLSATWHDTPVDTPCDTPAGSGIGSIAHPAAALAAPGQAAVRASAAVSPIRYRFICASVRRPPPRG